MVTVKEHRQYNHWNDKEVLMLKLEGMGGAAMDYAVHGHAVAHIPLGQFEIECKVFSKRCKRRCAPIAFTCCKNAPNCREIMSMCTLK